MRKNKTIFIIACFCIAICLFSGCKKIDVGITYNVKTGDSVTIYCANKELDFRPELPFSVLEKRTTLAQGNFITIEQYNQYIAGLNNADSTVTIYQKETKKDNITYVFYTTPSVSGNGNEYNYIIKINNSNTALVFGSTVSKEAAEKAFNAMQFQVKK